MKKFTKLSLVAAVAVAGLTSANAQALEEAIKNVDVSGSVVYRYNDQKNDVNKKSKTDNNYKIGLNLSSKVNDYVKFNSRFLVAGADGGFAGPLETSNDGDTNVETTLSHAYFGFTGIQNTTVNVGKQGLTTPWTVAIDSDGNEQTGTGILALSNMGPVTVAAAYFNQTNLGTSGNTLPDLNTTETITTPVFDPSGTLIGTFDESYENDDFGKKDIYTFGLIGNAGPVTLDAWYLNMDEVFDTYSFSATSDIKLAENAKIGLEARYVSLKLEDEVARNLGRDDKNSMFKLVVTGKISIVNAKLAYTKTDKKGGLTALDNDAKNTTLGWNLNSNNKFDADYFQAVVGVDLLDNLNLSANYGNIEHKSDNTSNASKIEEEEIYAQLTYKMSKNLSTYVRYGTYTKDITSVAGVKTKDNDDTRGRLQVEYTF